MRSFLSLLLTGVCAAWYMSEYMSEYSWTCGYVYAGGTQRGAHAALSDRDAASRGGCAA